MNFIRSFVSEKHCSLDDAIEHKIQVEELRNEMLNLLNSMPRQLPEFISSDLINMHRKVGKETNIYGKMYLNMRYHKYPDHVQFNYSYTYLRVYKDGSVRLEGECREVADYFQYLADNKDKWFDI